MNRLLPAEAREAAALRGVRFTGELVGAHVDGANRAENLVREFRSTCLRGDELLIAALDVAGKAQSHEGRSHARGFFRYLQKAIEVTP